MQLSTYSYLLVFWNLLSLFWHSWLIALLYPSYPTYKLVAPHLLQSVGFLQFPNCCLTSYRGNSYLIFRWSPPLGIGTPRAGTGIWTPNKFQLVFYRGLADDLLLQEMFDFLIGRYIASKSVSRFTASSVADSSETFSPNSSCQIFLKSSRAFWLNIKIRCRLSRFPCWGRPTKPATDLCKYFSKGLPFTTGFFKKKNCP